MNSTTGNAQFLTIDFRLLDNPQFCSFMRSPSFPLYLVLRRYVWRGAQRRHSVNKVNELYAAGYLVCTMPRLTLAEKLGFREVSHISRHLSELEARGVVRKMRTGRQNVYLLGTWEDRSAGHDRSDVIETFFLEQLLEPRHRSEPGPPKDAGTARVGLDTSDVSRPDTSDVSRPDTSDVSTSTHINKEKNREEKRCINDDVLQVVHTPREVADEPRYPVLRVRL